MKLSVCIIAKNEEKNIERCLKCLQPYAFEIVVVDTGSTDKTKEIAGRYTECLYDFVWCDDFAAAKNYAILKASNPFVLILDSDEFVEKIDVEGLVFFLEKYPNKVGRIHRKNVFTRRGERQMEREWINRIFLKEKYHYEGRIHEQIQRCDGKTYDTYHAPVEILHTGYDLYDEERKKKAQRNILLLEKELQLFEGNENTQEALEHVPYILHQLGKSYYMAGDYECACEYFSRGLSYDLNPKLEYVIDMVETYGYALLNSNQAEDALLLENIYDEFGESADFQFLMGLIYMNNARFEDAVNEFLKATQKKYCRVEGVNSYRAYYNVGVIYECLGEMEKALQYYQMCDEYEVAKWRLTEVLSILELRERRL